MGSDVSTARIQQVAAAVIPEAISGFSGWSGPGGISGWSGRSGWSGYSGLATSGFSGPSGYSGWSGIGGAVGASGTSGTSGFSGVSGLSGISGWSGFTGAVGTAGVSGFSGRSGWSGFSGLVGPSGLSGFSGTSGLSGTSGASGTSGWSGFSGLPLTDTGSLVTSISIASVERSIATLAIPANSLRVGSLFKFRAHGNFTMILAQSSLSICNVRIGPLSLAGNVAATVTVNNGKAKVSAPFMVEGEIIVRSIGVTGTIGGWLAMWGAAAAPFTDDITGLSTFALVNTAVPNILELTYVTTNAVAISVFDVAFIEGG